jgi:hypothetical protein
MKAHIPSADANHAAAVISTLLDELEELIRGTRAALPDERDRRAVAHLTRNRLYHAQVAAAWHLLDEMHARDREVVDALHELEFERSERGEWFNASGREIAGVSGVPTASVYAGTGRLEHLGLIHWVHGRGPKPGQVRLRWHEFSPYAEASST